MTAGAGHFYPRHPTPPHRQPRGAAIHRLQRAATHAIAYSLGFWTAELLLHIERRIGAVRIERLH